MIDLFAFMSDQSFDRLLQMVGAVVLAYLAYKTQSIGRQVNTVEKNTNSLTAQLVTKTEAEALSRGGRTERTQARERGDVRGEGIMTTPDATTTATPDASMPPPADPSIKARIEAVRVDVKEVQKTTDEIKDAVKSESER